MGKSHDKKLDNVEFEVSVDDRTVIDAGADAWKSYKTQVEGNPAIFIKAGLALKRIQEIATEKAGAPKGSAYNRWWLKGAEQFGFEGVEPSERGRLIRIASHGDDLTTWWNQKVTPAEKLKWHNPSTMWRRYADYAGIKKATPTSPRRKLADVKAELKVALETQSALQRELTAAKSGGSFEPPKSDPAKGNAGTAPERPEYKTIDEVVEATDPDTRAKLLDELLTLIEIGDLTLDEETLHRLRKIVGQADATGGDAGSVKETKAAAKARKQREKRAAAKQAKEAVA
jgi:hypothetical protein